MKSKKKIKKTLKKYYKNSKRVKRTYKKKYRYRKRGGSRLNPRQAYVFKNKGDVGIPVGSMVSMGSEFMHPESVKSLEKEERIKNARMKLENLEKRARKKHGSATKIQAVQRGNNARENLKEKNGPEPPPRPTEEEYNKLRLRGTNKSPDEILSELKQFNKNKYLLEPEPEPEFDPRLLERKLPDRPLPSTPIKLTASEKARDEIFGTGLTELQKETVKVDKGPTVLSNIQLGIQNKLTDTGKNITDKTKGISTALGGVASLAGKVETGASMVGQTNLSNLAGDTRVVAQKTQSGVDNLSKMTGDAVDYIGGNK